MPRLLLLPALAFAAVLVCFLCRAVPSAVLQRDDVARWRAEFHEGSSGEPNWKCASCFRNRTQAAPKSDPMMLGSLWHQFQKNPHPQQTCARTVSARVPRRRASQPIRKHAALHTKSQGGVKEIVARWGNGGPQNVSQLWVQISAPPVCTQRQRWAHIWFQELGPFFYEIQRPGAR